MARDRFQAAQVRAHDRAIGSVLPAELVGHAQPADSIWNAWTRSHPCVAAYGSARAALAALLKARAVERLWLPAYACPALAAAGRWCNLRWYGVDEALDPEVSLLADSLEAGDAVLVVTYFGRPPGHTIRTLAARRPDVLWIEDRAQCIEPPAIAWSDVILYSPRKVVGVGEGGVMVGNMPLPAPPASGRPGSSHAQRERRRDREGLHPERWFPAFQAQEAAIDPEGSAMGTATRRVLAGLSLTSKAAARRRNADFLTNALPDLVLWRDRHAGYAPLAVPIRIEHRDTVAAALADRRIYCARHWPELPSDPEAFPVAHRLSTQLLSIPCDQGADAVDMQRIADALRDIGARRAVH